jgi:hypothetical protein
MKIYPLDIDCVNYDQVSIFSKGHHDLALFNKLAKTYMADYPHIEFTEPAHQWWRAVPDGDEGMMICLAKPHSRGAWPVTTIEEK